MKKILIIISFLFSFLATFAQKTAYVPGRWEYEYLKAQKSLNIPKDTLHQSFDDTGSLRFKGVLRFWDGHKFDSVAKPTRLDTTRTDTTVRIGSGSNSALIFPSNDNLAGAVTAYNSRKLDAFEQLTSYDALRALPIKQVRSDVTYYLKVNNVLGEFRWVPTSTRADDSAMTVLHTGTVTGRFERIIPYWVDVRWFGYDPLNPGADVYPIVQKAANWIITNLENGVLYLPGGLYPMSKGLLLRRDDNHDGTSEFFTISVIGQKRAFGSGGGDGAETTFLCNDPLGFGMAIQKGKGCEIANIYFQGLNVKPLLEINLNNIDTATGVAWITSGLIHKRTAPNSALVIDPFGDASMDSAIARYPEYSQYYTETAAGGSTDIYFHDCAIRYFVVGVMNGPTPYIQNSEAHKFSRNWVDYCQSAYSNGQAQGRTIAIEHGQTWSSCEVVFDHQRWGVGNGSTMWVNDYNLAGNVKYICATNGFGMHPEFTVNNMHAESTYAIGGDLATEGYGPGGNITFTNSQLDFTSELTGYSHRAPVIAWCNTLKFENAFSGHYAIPDAPSLAHVLRLEYINAPGTLVFPDNIEYTDQKMWISTTPASNVTNYMDYLRGTVQLNLNLIQNGFTITKSNSSIFGASSYKTISTYTGHFVLVHQLSGTFNVVDASDSLNGKYTISYPVADTFKIMPGAAVIAPLSGYLQCIGVVFSIDNSTHTFVLSQAKSSIVNTMVFQFGYLVAEQRFGQFPLFAQGDIAFGSNVITNVTGEFDVSCDNIFEPGHYFDHPAFPKGTWIKAVTATTLTLSSAATYTESQSYVSYSDQWNTKLYKDGSQVSGYEAFIFKKGDQMVTTMNAQNTDSLYTVAIQSGYYPVGTPAAVFKSATNGTSGGAATITSLPDTLAFTSFAGPNNPTALPATLASATWPSYTWAQNYGTWGITSSKAYENSGAGGPKNATIDIGRSDSVVVSADLLTTPTSASGLVLRQSFVSNDTFLYVYHAVGGMQLILYQNGTQTALVTNIFPVSPGVHNWKVSVNNLTFKIYYDDTLKSTYTTTADTALANGSHPRWGMINAGDATNQFDNFTITSTTEPRYYVGTKSINGALKYIPIPPAGYTSADTASTISTKANVTKVANDTATVARGARHFVNVKTDFHAVGDGSTDDVAAIQNANAYAVANGYDVYFPASTYYINTFLSVNLTNVRWFGDGANSIIKGNRDSVIVPTAFTGSILEDFSLTTQLVSSTQASAGMLNIRHINFTGNKIRRVNFSCPTSNNDAITVIMNLADSVWSTVMANNDITYNNFVNIGRIAIDVFNRKFSVSAHAFVRDNHIDHNYFDSTGAKGSFGMAISFDGSGQGNSINYNTINNMLSAGIEVQAHYGDQIIGNNIYYTTRSFEPITVDAQGANNYAYGLDIGDNTTYGANTYWNFFSMNYSRVHNNHSYAALNTSANDATFFFIGSSYNTIDGNIIIGSTAALRISSQPTAGTYFNKPSTGNVVKNNIFTASPGLSTRALIRLDSSLTTFNFINGNNLYIGSDSAYYRIDGSASDNSTCGNYEDNILANPCSGGGGVSSITFTNGITQDATVGDVNASLDTSANSLHPATQGYVDRAIQNNPKDTNLVQNTNRDLYTGYKILFVSNSGDTLRGIIIDTVGNDILITKDSTSPGRQRLKIGLAKGGTPTTNSLGTNVTSATVTTGGKDHWFQLTVVTSGNVNGTVCNIAFGTAFSAIPVAISPGFGADAATAAATSKTWCNGTSVSAASFGATITGAGTYIFNFQFNNP